jgi:hypothetical protein
MQYDPIKIVFAVLISLYILWCSANPFDAVFLHSLNLAIHETGHLVFRIFGEFLGVAGGSLLQIIFPLLFVGYFIWHEKYYSASIVMMWFGQNWTDVSVYAADAVVMQLPLLGGLTGSEGGFHDWNYLLDSLGFLHYTTPIAKAMAFIGVMIVLVSTASALLFATKGESILSDEEL